MKILPFALLILSLLISLKASAQKDKINDTYIWDMKEYLTITEDSFKLNLYPVYSLLYGLDLGDSILAEGKVQYDSNNFIKLTSKDYEWETKKNVVVIESIDSSLTDSIKFNFIFPFDGKYKIILSLEGDCKNQLKYEFEDRKEVILPKLEYPIFAFSFIIVNQTPIEFPYRIYQKMVNFRSFQNIVKESDSNSFEIFIPDLTNSYFNRFFINGEYLKIDTEKNVIFWHNEKYIKHGEIIK